MKVKVLEAKKSNESVFSKFSPTHTNTYNIFAMWPDNHLKAIQAGALANKSEYPA